MKEALLAIVEKLIDFPQHLQISEIATGSTSVFDITVDKRDLGKVIGKQGRIADALRTLLISAGAKLNRRYILQVLDKDEHSQE